MPRKTHFEKTLAPVRVGLSDFLVIDMARGFTKESDSEFGRKSQIARAEAILKKRKIDPESVRAGAVQDIPRKASR